MSRLFKKKKKDVEYNEFGKGEAYHLKTEVQGKKADIIAFYLPTDKRLDTKVKAGMSKEGALAEGERTRESKGSWEAIIVTPEYGYLPYDTWKNLRKQVAGTVSAATGAAIRASDVRVSGSIVVSETPKCPKCGATIFISGEKCPNCGASLS
jgi:ribosomal protein S27AE